MMQNEKPENYHHAYLVTAPRFLGYSFNPASFWYLYDEQKKLDAMIVEVNNTFDERRMYFLKSTDSRDTRLSHINGAANEDRQYNEPEPMPVGTDSVHQTSAKFTKTWPKDFHVSPFNSRKGSYTLNAHDPFFPYLSGKGQVNNTITLSSSKAHAKIIARVFSTQEAIDPESLDRWGKLKFIISWWWVGFVTFPRIIREAGKLFFRRKLHVWYRPEVLNESIGRRETSDER